MRLVHRLCGVLYRGVRLVEEKPVEQPKKSKPQQRPSPRTHREPWVEVERWSANWERCGGANGEQSPQPNDGEGAQDLADRRRRGTRTRKPRYRRDHWWDSCAMMLVAQSVEAWLREYVQKERLSLAEKLINERSANPRLARESDIGDRSRVRLEASFPSIRPTVLSRRPGVDRSVSNDTVRIGSLAQMPAHSVAGLGDR